MYSSFRACATTTSKSKEKSENDVQNTRSEDFWLFEELDHQDLCSIKDLRSLTRVERNQLHASRFDKNYLLSVYFQVWLCELKKKNCQRRHRQIRKFANNSRPLRPRVVVGLRWSALIHLSIQLSGIIFWAQITTCRQLLRPRRPSKFVI